MNSSELWVVGAYGGNSKHTLGPAADVQLFFDCIDQYVVPRHPGKAWELISDRLYKRYVRSDDVDATLALLDVVKSSFATIDSKMIDWGSQSTESGNSLLDPKLADLSKIFARYFSAYSGAAENATVNADLVEIDPTYVYQAVRTCVIDTLRFIEEMPLYPESYDALDGPPIWRRWRLVLV